MQLIKIGGVKLDAVIACMPADAIDNLEDCRRLYGEEADNIVRSTGILKKYYATKGVSSLDLCVEAANRLFLEYEATRREIGAVLCVTFTPEKPLPANAIIAQHRLGIPTDCLAFDINLACSGYGYGLWLAATIAKQIGKKVLLLDGDVQSPWISPYDKSTMPVLSDAGTASLISCDETADDWFFGFYTNGERSEILSIQAGGSGRPVSSDELKYIEYPDGSKRRSLDIAMDGFEVFRFVAQVVSKKLSDFMVASGVGPSEIDAFVPHQANMYMVKQLAKKIGISQDKVLLSGDKYGNPASASVPLTIASEISSRVGGKKRNRVLLSGFGAGLSISAAMLSVEQGIRSEVFHSKS